MTEADSMTYRASKLHLTIAAGAATLFFSWASVNPTMAQTAHRGDGPIACSDFQRGANGSWIVLHPTTIIPEGVKLSLAPGQTFAKNQMVNGVEVTTVLDRNCGNM